MTLKIPSAIPSAKRKTWRTFLVFSHKNVILQLSLGIKIHSDTIYSEKWALCFHNLQPVDAFDLYFISYDEDLAINLKDYYVFVVPMVVAMDSAIPEIT